MAPTFDPSVETQKLRDHLASHDKPIAFLFGAGTSVVPGTDDKPLVPAVVELTKRCAAAVAEEDASHGAAWDLIAAAGTNRTIEDILSAVRRMREAILPGDTLGGLDSGGLKTLETAIQEAISREVTPPDARIPRDLPHRALGRWIRRLERSSPVEVFTTNYDTLFERALECEGVPLFDGFVGAHRPFFMPASLAREHMAPGRRWTRLWKMHGSVTWVQSSNADGRIIRSEEQPSGEMILPSLLKYDESRKQPYLAIMDRLRRALAEREDAILVTVGYSFADQHINEVIFEALDANPKMHLFALCHSDPKADSELGREARRRTNILVLGPTQAIVRCEVGSWLMQDPATNGARMEGLFIPGAAPASSGAVDGELKLGDFTVFCTLLDQIAGKDA